MRLLVVEDEPKTAGFLEKGLTQNGFVVVQSDRGDEALALAKSENYCAIVLDVALPQVSGFGVLAALRASGNNTPVLFLTARDSVHDRVRGLELGADDYLIKPFSFSELLARLRSILRRAHGGGVEPVIKIDDLELDLPRLRAARGGRKLDLTAKEFQLLALLARRQGEVLSRTVIAEEVWDMNFDSDTNVVEVAIRRIRKKVDDPFPTKLIRTVRGVGYAVSSSRDGSG
jgi:two-component system, OmpR family, copper resistance phosphate regulon response regulator CusR